MEVARKLSLLFDRSNKLKLEYRTKSEKGAQVCEFPYSPGNQKNESKKGKKALGITQRESTQVEKSETREFSQASIWIRRQMFQDFLEKHTEMQGFLFASSQLLSVKSMRSELWCLKL